MNWLHVDFIFKVSTLGMRLERCGQNVQMQCSALLSLKPLQESQDALPPPPLVLIDRAAVSWRLA
jgi:hypothetical protein